MLKKKTFSIFNENSVKIYFRKQQLSSMIPMLRLNVKI